MSKHACHARGCEVEVNPCLLMCPKHWRLVPNELKNEVWSAYQPGQEESKAVSSEFLTAARKAIDAVAAREKDDGLL